MTKEEVDTCDKIKTDITIKTKKQESGLLITISKGIEMRSQIIILTERIEGKTVVLANIDQTINLTDISLALDRNIIIDRMKFERVMNK